MNRDKLPEQICFVASLFFLGSIIPIVIIEPKIQPMTIVMSVVGGLFFFTLCLIMNLLTRIDRLEKLNNISSSKSTESQDGPRTPGESRP